MGIVVEKIGPFQLDAKHWQYDFFPAPTDFCNACAARVSKGKRPACVQHCQTQCLEFGEFSEFVGKLDKKRAVFVL
jgi:anaerobic dimethyl sulfoxide reductase subunit B (iron-sulfur subunit)